MKIYKAVPCPGRMVVKKNENLSKALQTFSDIVSQESLGGWELVSSIPVVTVTKLKRLSSVEEPYNVLIFAKEDEE